METVACNLGGSTRHTALYQMPHRRGYQAGVFTVVEGNQCGLGFVNPRLFGLMRYHLKLLKVENRPRRLR